MAIAVENGTITLEYGLAVLHKDQLTLTLKPITSTPSYVNQSEIEIYVHTNNCVNMFTTLWFISPNGKLPMCLSREKCVHKHNVALNKILIGYKNELSIHTIM